MEISRFEFRSAGERLVGLLHVPSRYPIAALVITGPLTSVKEQIACNYARVLAEHGFVALAFDHRYFGASGGQPRQLENPAAKITDIRAAVGALRESLGTSRLPIAGLGVCAGGGYMARAIAEEKRLSAFIGVAGYYAAVNPPLSEAAQTGIARGRAAEQAWLTRGIVESIPAVGTEGGDVAMPLREAFEYYSSTERGAVPTYRNEFAIQSRAYTIPFDALGAAPLIGVPTLMVHSHHALAPALAHQFFSLLAGPKEELWLPSKGQTDFYDDKALVLSVTEAITDFGTRVLGTGA